jgi:MoxR-like ATPase
LEDYVLQLTRSSRSNNDIMLGVSPRGSLALYHTSQALAAVQGRDYVMPDDIKRLTTSVLAHRLILTPDARLRGRSTEHVLADLVNEIPVPVEEVWEQPA